MTSHILILSLNTKQAREVLNALEVAEVEDMLDPLAEGIRDRLRRFVEK